MSASKLSEQIAMELIPINIKVPDDEGRPYAFEQSKITWHRIAVAEALDEMALRVFKDTRERAAKVAQEILSQTHIIEAEWLRPIEAIKAIRAMQPDILAK